MKVFRIATIFLSFLLYSCHYDREDEATSIQYRVVVEGPILKEVAYKSADGLITTIDSLNEVKIWHTTEFFNTDFEAHFKVTFANNSDYHEPYKLSCFVDGELVSVREGTVSPLTEKNEEVKYLVQN